MNQVKGPKSRLTQRIFFGLKIFFNNYPKIDTQIFCVLYCLCWERNTYKHCTKLGLFDACIQLEFISPTELQNTIILYIINIFSKEVLLEV
jgi:hypothetical protein